MATRKLLVVGATGAQGGAVIDALLANKSNFDIYGLTRNKASPSALKLAERNVKMVEGDVKKPTTIFEKIGKVWGVFSMTNIGPDEEEEAKPLIDCAIAKGAQFFVFTSVYRGAKSDVDPTYVPHFITKYNIEKYLIEKAAKSPQKMGWTILRPAGFMDYFGPGFASKSMARFVHQMGDKKLQVVYTKDIGKVAVYALENTEKCNGKAFPLAGDSLNFQEMNKIFHEEVGHNLPMAPSFLVSLFFYFSNELGKMARWFKEGGYNLDLDRSEEFPRPIDFRTWLRTASKWNVKE